MDVDKYKTEFEEWLPINSKYSNQKHYLSYRHQYKKQLIWIGSLSLNYIQIKLPYFGNRKGYLNLSQR